MGVVRPGATPSVQYCFKGTIVLRPASGDGRADGCAKEAWVSFVITLKL